MKCVILTGMSGSGKSTALKMIEDMGYFCVGNLPISLVESVVQLAENDPELDKVAINVDVRSGQNIGDLNAILDRLEEQGKSFEMLFLECDDSVIIKRYKETRRGHPLAKDGRTLVQAAELERAAMAPVRKRAEYIIDTTALSTAKLHGEVLRLFGTPGQGPEMSVSVVSFGFKYGVPIEADLVFDVRCLPNPFYIAELRRQTGLDAGVRDFLWGYQQTADLVKHLEDLMSFLLPLYVEEGKIFAERARARWSSPSAVPGASTARWPSPGPWRTSSVRRAITPARTTGI